MKNYFLKRVLTTLLILFGVLLITFVMMYVVPGDPVQSFVGQRADEETILNLKKAWGLDQPLPYQFLKYIGRVLRGDLGRSYFTHESVFQGLIERLPNTFLLACLAILI